MPFISEKILNKIGFASLGVDIQISDKAVFYNPANIHIGSRVRIDDFCLLSAGKGGIYIGSNIHIAVGATLRGGGKIILKDFSNVGGKVDIYSSGDDFSGNYLMGPTVPSDYTNVSECKVVLEKHSIVGAHSIILPGAVMGEGAAVGANSLVKTNLKPWYIYAGNPVKAIKKRKKELLKLEKAYLKKHSL